MLKYWLFRLAVALVPRIPRGISYGVAPVLGVLFWALSPRLRRRAEFNLGHIPSLASDPARLRRAVRDLFYHTVLNYIDLFRGATLTDAEVRAMWDVEGEEALDAAMAEGHGVVFLAPHVSGFEAGATRLGVKGYRVVAPAERLKPEALFALVRRVREHHGFHFLPADSRETLRDLMDALKRNEIAVFGVDRYITGSSAEIPFFGVPARMPTTPAALALRLGAPVGIAYAYRTAPERAHAVYIPVDVEAVRAPGGGGQGGGGKRGQNDEAVIRLQRLFLEHLEQYVEQHPEQWLSALARVWEE
jgi:lauroyl/myristoyl acyltransferase